MEHTDDRIRLHPAVFYRKYEDQTILYHTEQQKVYTFNPTAGEILDCFRSWRTLADAAASLSREYEIADPAEFCSEIGGFVGELLDKGILKREYRQKARYKTLEKEIGQAFSDRKQLYSVLFELTYHCNEKCRHCYIVDEHRQELSAQEIKGILDELAEMNVLNLVFTGGELFTRKDAFEILEYAYQKGFVTDIFTNGNLLDGGDCIRLKLLYPRSVHFSVYSHVPEKHDGVTGVRGSLEKTLNAIRACVAAGIPVNVKSPIFEETADDVSGLVRLAEELGVSIEIGSNITPKKDGNLAPTAMKIADEEKERQLIRQLQALIPSDEPEEDDGGRRDNLRICGAGDKSISINPYGEVFPCNMLQLCIGDVRKSSVREIWEGSEALRRWRERNLRRNRKGCERCAYADRCVFCPGEALMRTGDPLSKYEKACRATYAAVEEAQRREGNTDETV